MANYPLPNFASLAPLGAGGLSPAVAAYYDSSEDCVCFAPLYYRLPVKAQRWLLSHELGHATGHATRLGRASLREAELAFVGLSPLELLAGLGDEPWDGWAPYVIEEHVAELVAHHCAERLKGAPYEDYLTRLCRLTDFWPDEVTYAQPGYAAALVVQGWVEELQNTTLWPQVADQ